MNELEQRVKTLEDKVKLLEETLETLKNMSLSEQMGSFIQSRQKSLRMVELLNSVSDDGKLDFEKERATLENVRASKRNIDSQIQKAISENGTFSDAYPNDPRYFNYEIENAMITGALWKRQEKLQVLSKYEGKGLRITAYNGFETDRVIIPKEIDGLPVVSIGEKAFMNATLSEVILPKSIKAILGEAFSGCKNLKTIDLPDGIEYLGDLCFSGSGLSELSFPNTLKIIPCLCCSGCEDLETINFGGQVLKIAYGAFSCCGKIRDVSLPNSLTEIESGAFQQTNISAIIIPSMVRKISKKSFGDTPFRSKGNVVCVFLGKDTTMDGKLTNVSLIYCLPGSKIQQAARQYSIPIKPLSEFRMEDYQ